MPFAPVQPPPSPDERLRLLARNPFIATPLIVVAPHAVTLAVVQARWNCLRTTS